MFPVERPCLSSRSPGGRRGTRSSHTQLRVRAGPGSGTSGICWSGERAAGDSVLDHGQAKPFPFPEKHRNSQTCGAREELFSSGFGFFFPWLVFTLFSFLLHEVFSQLSAAGAAVVTFCSRVFKKGRKEVGGKKFFRICFPPHASVGYFLPPRSTFF